MTSPYGHAAIAADRHATLIAGARERGRRQEARTAVRSRSTVAQPNRSTARDHEPFFIRPIDRADEALLVEGFARLSDRSRRLRYLGLRNTLSSAELHDLTHVDHHDREALLAVTEDDGRAIGIAQYVRDATSPGAAEIAVTVIDDSQRRGVGTELLTRLIARGQDEGIDRLIALVADDNVGAIRLLCRLGYGVTVVDQDSNATQYEITIGAGELTGPKELALLCS